MLITGTSDLIQFKLGGSASTQLPFNVNYNNYTATSVSLFTNNGVSNDTTAVSLVTSPSSGQQNELRYCSIYNADTSTQTITIQVYDGSNTRVVFKAVLASGDMLQYQLEKGWEVIDSTGDKKNYASAAFSSSIRGGLKTFRPQGITGTATLTTQVPAFIYLGRAEKSYSTINVVYNVTTLMSTVTWAELAIFTGPQMATEVALPHGKRAGFTDTSAVWTSTGVKNTQVSVSGINPGDILRVWFGAVASVMPAFRTVGWNMDISDQSCGTFTGVNGSAQMSKIGTIYAGAATTPTIWAAWQGN